LARHAQWHRTDISLIENGKVPSLLSSERIGRAFLVHPAVLRAPEFFQIEKEEPPTTPGKMLKRLRLIWGYTPSEVGIEIGRTYLKIENEKEPLSLPLAIALGKFYFAHPAVLLDPQLKLHHFPNNIGRESMKPNDLVHALRQQRRWTIEQLARKTGFGFEYLIMIEEGTTPLSRSAAEKMGKAFGLRPVVFLYPGLQEEDLFLPLLPFHNLRLNPSITVTN